MGLQDEVKTIKSNSIVESGSNNSGHFRKYADGTLEMWRSNDYNVWITNNNGAPYYSNAFSASFPVASVTSAVVTSQIRSSGTVWICGTTAEMNKTATSFRAFSISA